MATERAILCGSVNDGSLPFKDRHSLRLHLWGPHRNVHLTIQDVRHAMVKPVPSVFLDLIDIATYVYCADQAVTRGGDGVLDLGGNWRRDFFFRIPVRDPKVWKDNRTLNELVSTLSFLSEDQYRFEFEKLTKDPSFESYLQFSSTPYEGIVEEVVMFSGGIDSVGGAVQEAVLDKRKVVLVNHRSTEKFSRRHRRLMELLEDQAKAARPLHVPVRINKAKSLGREYTQRTRSFLYASLGATIATMLGLSRLRFYENGIVSLNLPPSPQVVGARATRTTHPQVLNGFSKLFTRLAGKTFAVENPFLWKTKTEVVRLIADAGCGKLLKHATSCTRTWEITREHTHCGTCSQCIDRRFAALAANQDANDPADAYKVDLLIGERSAGEPRTMLAAYLETANELEKMDAVQFFSRFGEASRALKHLDAPPDVSGMQIFDLHRRHAKQVTGVIDRAFAKYGAEVRTRSLPTSCLLRLVYDTGPSNAQATPIAQDMPAETNVFRKKGQVWLVRFAGADDFILLPSKGAAYLHQLLSQPHVHLSAIDMACRVAKNRDQYALGSAGEVSDREALQAYGAKLVELRKDLDKAKRNNDPGAQEKIEEEIESLVREIRAASGLGGRLRKVSDHRERVRKAVANAVKRAIKEIAKYDAPLAEHFSRPRLVCGQNPCYAPDQDIEWQV